MLYVTDLGSGMFAICTADTFCASLSVSYPHFPAVDIVFYINLLTYSLSCRLA